MPSEACARPVPNGRDLLLHAKMHRDWPASVVPIVRVEIVAGKGDVDAVNQGDSVVSIYF
jgi:hypothetical protein